jgi:WD40 repeat protein/serine/threonine protein kinase
MGTILEQSPGDANDSISIEDSHDYARFDALAEEFADRYRRGERPSLTEYVDRLPQMADAIREMFPALVEVERVERDVRAGALGLPPLAPAIREIGDYRIVREIGRGGMGVVYEAEQISLGRRVALKVLPHQVSSDRMIRERFRREARSAARLHHTNIVPVYEVGQDGDVRFYAMQLIQGQGLEAVINELRQLRDRSGNASKIKAPSVPHASWLGQAHLGQSLERSSRNPEIEVSAVLQSIFAGRFDPRAQRIDPVVDDSRSKQEGPAVGVITTQAGTGIERSVPGRTGALPRTEVDDQLAGGASSPKVANPSPPRFLSSSTTASTSSPILPGGTQLSSAESGHRSYFRSLAHIGRQIAGGLAYAHARGIVHRDIKPSNLLLDTEGVVWITDFGLAKGDDEGLTQSGDILGTIRYMAPERFRGEGDARADIYALGLTLYELLTLRSGFQASDRLELIEQIKTEDPPSPRSLDGRIPRDLETIVLKAIEKDPRVRYQTAEALGEDLRRFLADEPIRARQVSPGERYWRWARRNPAIATLGAVLTVVLVLATVCSLFAVQRFRIQAQAQSTLASAREVARAEEAAARFKADQANTSLRAKEEELRRTVYATRSNLALAAWDVADIGRVRSLLDLLRPAPSEPDIRGWEWRYLWQLVHEDRLALRAQDDGFTDVVFSPDRKILAGLEGKGRIHLWNRHGGKSPRTIGAPTHARTADLASGVSALAFSPDGRSLAGPGLGDTLMLYDVDSGLPTLSFEGSPGAVLGLAFSPDGRTLIASISAHSMRVWDARDGHLIRRVFGGHGGPVAAVAFSPDGRIIASAGYDHLVKLWKPENQWQELVKLEGHTDEVRAVAFSPDGRRVASAGLDRSLRLWDARSAAELAVIRGHAGSVTSLAFSPDGSKLVTGSADETVRVWNVASGQEIRNFKGHTDEIRAVEFSLDGSEVASASADMTVRLWNPANPPRPHTLESPSVLTYGGSVDCLAFSPDGSRLVSGHDDHALRTWELPTGRLLNLIKGHTNIINCVAFSPDGRIIASGSRDRTVKLWDAETGAARSMFKGHTDEVGALIFTPDGQSVLSGSYDHTIQAWDPNSGAVRFVLKDPSAVIRDLALGPDGRTLASAHRDSTCILWDLSERRPRLTLRGHTGPVNAMAFSPDGRTVATSSNDNTIRLWDLADGSQRETLRGHIDGVYGLAFSPDGRLASSSKDRTIRIWDTASRQTVLIIKAHAGRIRCIKFSPDGRTLASASDDRTLKLWEAAPDAALAAGSNAASENTAETGSAPPASAPHALLPKDYAKASNLALAAWESHDVNRLRFLLDLMNAPEAKPDLQGWEWHYLNALAHQEKLTFLEHDREVSQATFSPDGLTVASVQWGGRVKVWSPVTGKSRLTLDPPQPLPKDPSIAGVSALAFSPDGTRLAGPGPNLTLGIWNTQSGRMLVNFNVNSTGTQTVDWSPGGRSIVTGSTSKHVRVWDATDGKLLRLFENAHDQIVQRVVFRPGGRHVASACEGAIKLWDVEAGKVQAIAPCANVQVFGLLFSPDGRTLVSGGSDTLVRFWDAETGRERARPWENDSAVTALAIRQDGARLASAGSDGVIKLWDFPTGRQIRTFKGHTDRIGSIAFSPDGNTLSSSSFDKTVKLWDLNRPPQFSTQKASSATTTGVLKIGVAKSPDGRRLVSAASDETIKLSDTATGLDLLTLKTHSGPVRSVAFSPDGRQIAATGEDGTVNVWDASTQAVTASTPAPETLKKDKK